MKTLTSSNFKELPPDQQTFLKQNKTVSLNGFDDKANAILAMKINQNQELKDQAKLVDYYFQMLSPSYTIAQAKLGRLQELQIKKMEIQDKSMGSGGIYYLAQDQFGQYHIVMYKFKKAYILDTFNNFNKAMKTIFECLYHEVKKECA